MAYLTSLNCYAGGPNVAYRTPPLSAFFTSTTGNMTSGQSTTLPGLWSFSPANSVLPANVTASSLMNTGKMTLTIPYDGIYVLTFGMRTNTNSSGSNTNTNQFGWWQVTNGSMISTNSRLAFTHTFGDTISSTYTGFFHANDQLRPSCFTGGSNITTVEQTQNAPYLCVTLISPSTNYDSTAAQNAGAVIMS